MAKLPVTARSAMDSIAGMKMEMPGYRLKAGPEYVSSTGITWNALKCRLGAGLTPYEIGACIGKRESDVLAAMAEYKLKPLKPKKKRRGEARRWKETAEADGVTLVRHSMMPPERAVQIYQFAKQGMTAGQISRSAHITYTSVVNFLQQNNL